MRALPRLISQSIVAAIRLSMPRLVDEEDVDNAPALFQ
jgi:hypothetical protein